MTALRRALHGLHQSKGTAQIQRIPEIHHSDQGVQYAANGYVQLLKEAGVAISMAEVGAAWQNGYAERLMRTIKEEEVQLQEYEDYQDAYRQIGKFLDDVYMQKRIHSSLGYLTPTEFEQQWQEGPGQQEGQELGLHLHSDPEPINSHPSFLCPHSGAQYTLPTATLHYFPSAGTLVVDVLEQSKRTRARTSPPIHRSLSDIKAVVKVKVRIEISVGIGTTLHSCPSQ